MTNAYNISTDFDINDTAAWIAFNRAMDEKQALESAEIARAWIDGAYQ